MHILIVGMDTPGALERYCARGLRAPGHEVSFFDLHEELAAKARFMQTPVLAEIEQSWLRGPYNRRLLQRVRDLRPDLVLVIKGIEIEPATLKAIRVMPGAPLLLNWNPDSPFDAAVSNSSPGLLASIQHYDCYFTYDSRLFDLLKAQGARRVEWLPFGYDAAEHHPVELDAAGRARFGSELCFVGAYSPERAEHLSALADFDLAIWGPNWERLASSSPLHRHLRGHYLAGEEMSAAFSGAQIVLNFLRAQNALSHNMRTFEAPASGAFMLASHSPDQAQWLPPGEAAAYFSTLEEMRAQVVYYLRQEEERHAIAAEGHRRMLTGAHSYHHRMQQILTLVHSLA